MICSDHFETAPFLSIFSAEKSGHFFYINKKKKLSFFALFWYNMICCKVLNFKDFAVPEKGHRNPSGKNVFPFPRRENAEVQYGRRI